MTPEEVVHLYQARMCAGGGADGLQVGARKMLGKQPGGEREEGLAKFRLVLVRAPTRIRKMDHHHRKELLQLHASK